MWDLGEPRCQSPQGQKSWGSTLGDEDKTVRDWLPKADKHRLIGEVSSHQQLKEIVIE